MSCSFEARVALKQQRDEVVMSMSMRGLEDECQPEESPGHHQPLLQPYSDIITPQAALLTPHRRDKWNKSSHEAPAATTASVW